MYRGENGVVACAAGMSGRDDAGLYLGGAKLGSSERSAFSDPLFFCSARETPDGLLADLYGRKISYGGFTAGPKYGPMVKKENQRALELDAKNPRAWASLGRQYFMAPKMFGGDTGKAVESFRKSLELDPQQDETWVWLAKAYQKQGDKAGAHDAIQHALQLNPQSGFARDIGASLER